MKEKNNASEVNELNEIMNDFVNKNGLDDFLNILYSTIVQYRTLKVSCDILDAIEHHWLEKAKEEIENW